MNPLLSALRRRLRPYSPRPRIHQWLFRRPARFEFDAPVASFTFDDIPRSAFVNGGPILQRFGARATYYLALSYMDGEAPWCGPFFTRADLDAMVTEGHEIGCHTCAHIGARQTSLARFEAEILENRRRMRELLPACELRHFAYPGGEITLRLKRRMRHYARTSRSTYWGVNRRSSDLDLLLCQHLFESVPLDHVRKVVQEAVADPGWIVFYGHDVCDKPSTYGCTPGYLEAVLEIVAPACRILTVGEAFDLFSGSRSAERGEPAGRSAPLSKINE